MKNLLIISLLFLSGCTHTNTNPNSYFVIHNTLPKNLQLVDIKINTLATGTHIKGNVKYSTRRSRFSRPKGALSIKILKKNGDIVLNRSLKLTKRGRMPRYSRFDFLLNESAVTTQNHLYLTYF